MKKKQAQRGRPSLKASEKFSQRFVVMLTRRQKKSVVEQGGSGLVRSLVEDYLRHAAD